MSEIRTTFHKHLREIQNDILAMGSMVEKAIGYSIQALKNRDLDLAHQILENDKRINQKRFDIEEKCIELIATQQPMAGDLRTLVAVLNIIIELERIADHAEGIAKIVLLHGEQPLAKPLVDLPRMAERARAMLRGSLTAFIERDAAAARRIAAQDDAVDGLYDQIYGDLLAIMIRDPGTIDRATWLLWAAHNLERIADRVTNICERVVFEVSGKMQEMNVSTY